MFFPNHWLLEECIHCMYTTSILQMRTTKIAVLVFPTPCGPPHSPVMCDVRVCLDIMPGLHQTAPSWPNAGVLLGGACIEGGLNSYAIGIKFVREK